MNEAERKQKFIDEYETLCRKHRMYVTHDVTETWMLSNMSKGNDGTLKRQIKELKQSNVQDWS